MLLSSCSVSDIFNYLYIESFDVMVVDIKKKTTRKTVWLSLQTINRFYIVFYYDLHNRYNLQFIDLQVLLYINHQGVRLLVPSDFGLINNQTKVRSIKRLIDSEIIERKENNHKSLISCYQLTEKIKRLYNFDLVKKLADYDLKESKKKLA